MKFKTILLKESSPASVTTELMYEIASAHATGVELLKVNIEKCDEEKLFARLFNASIRLLKKVKSDGMIQFYATEQSFSSMSMEAEFLLNKYSDIIENDKGEASGYIYVRV